MQRNRRPSNQTLALLAVLFEQSRSWHHGYELAQQTGLRSGTLYPLLIRLRDRVPLESKWQISDSVGRSPRRQYRLTASGLTYSKEHLLKFALPSKAARAAA